VPCALYHIPLHVIVEPVMDLTLAEDFLITNVAGTLAVLAYTRAENLFIRSGAHAESD